MSVFEKYRDKVYQYRYATEIIVGNLHGGVPTDPKVAEAWIKTKMTEDRDDVVKELVAKTMAERGLDPADPLTTEQLDEVVAEAVKARQLSGFYRTPEGELAIRGRHVKAMIKEAANIAYAKDRWGPTNKGTKSFFAEHVFVAEDWIPLGRSAPDGIDQRFVSTWRGTGIQYDEYVEDVKVSFTVMTDHKFTADQWGTLWVIAERNGLGAARSQGFGTFEVTGWDLAK